MIFPFSTWGNISQYTIVYYIISYTDILYYPKIIRPDCSTRPNHLQGVMVKDQVQVAELDHGDDQ